MAINMRWVEMGKPEPRDGIAAQTPVLVALARVPENAVLLAKFGWTPERTDRLEKIGFELITARAEQADARDVSLLATVSQNEAMSNAKLLKRKLVRAVRSVFRRHDDLPVSKEAFAANETIGRSVPKMLAWLTTVEPQVEKISDKLAVPMGIEDPFAAVGKMRHQLSVYDTEQEVKLADLPVDTLEVYERKGEAMMEIADLIDIAHNALEENAPEAAKFNKDLIVKARKRRKPTARTSAA